MRILTVCFLLFSICAFGQEILSDYESLPRHYGIEVDLVEDSVTFEYKVIYTEEDSSKQYIYRTEDIDTFLLLMKRDLKRLPDDKDNVLSYLHGMMGGQVVNMNFTITGLTELYIHPEESDIGRLLWIRWPGNFPVYVRDKENAYAIAEDVAAKLLLINESISKIKSDKGTPVENDFIAHSLGCELFKEIHSYIQPPRPMYGDVILSAADLDTDVFLQDGSLASLHLYTKRSTMYYSSKDLTLTISKNLNKKPRLGLDGTHEDSVILPSYYFVDVTDISDETFLPMKLTGHAYYRGSKRVSEDMLATLRGEDAALVPGRNENPDRPNHFILLTEESPE